MGQKPRLSQFEMRAGLWVPPSTAHEYDIEFESDELPAAWAESFTASASAIDPYAGFSSGAPRRDVNTWRKSCYSIQAPGDNTGYSVSRAVTVPTNFLVWIRGSFGYRVDQNLNNDGGIGLELGETSGGQIDLNNRATIFLFESDTSTTAGLQAQYTDGGSTTILKQVAQGTGGSGHLYEYVAIHKVGSAYHFWAFTTTGQAIWLGSGSPTISPDRVGLTFTNNSTSSPGTTVCTVDFVRFVESATVLPGYGE